jgi:hypothetical protein
VLALAAGCQFAPGGQAGDGDGSDPDGGVEPDAGPAPVDGAPPDAQPDAPPPVESAHLLLTEVKTQPTEAEFIEIFNPLSVEVPLRDHYLSDDPLYAELPGAGDVELVVENGDAILRFPEGASLLPGQVIVVALDEQGFRDAFGADADYALVPASTPVSTPMEAVADGFVPMRIIDDGEPIILFRWDGLDDLVTDVDIVVVGNRARPPGDDNGVPDKSAVAVDGPDPDRRASSYSPDIATMPSMSFRSGDDSSYQRIGPEGDEEQVGDGNGVAGHDETSEQTLTTWGQTSAAPTPGVVPPGLR